MKNRKMRFTVKNVAESLFFVEGLNSPM